MLPNNTRFEQIKNIVYIQNGPKTVGSCINGAIGEQCDLNKFKKYVTSEITMHEQERKMYRSVVVERSQLEQKGIFRRFQSLIMHY